MATSVLSMAGSYLGLKGVPQPAQKKKAIPLGETQYDKNNPVRALPASWYTSEGMYQLERRAIFSKKWIFITHRNRLKEPGDFLRYTLADYDFNIALDRKGQVNAFHNVCRHRAYPVNEQQEGNKKIFSCRYHGWSYGLDGKLAKAPGYQEVKGFDKSKNGLLPIHVHIDGNGFIWVNLDSSSEPIPWKDDFENVDEQPRLKEYNFNDYVLDHTYSLPGEFNWKILADNFNECYHCKTTHADVPTFLTIDSHDLAAKDGHMQHDSATTEEQRKKGLSVNSTYFFPCSSMTITPHFMMLQKFLPSGPTTSAMSYEVYRNKNSSEEDFKLIADSYARVMAEDKVLCAGQQKNLNAGVFEAGELHPRWEKGPLYFQSQVRTAIRDHVEQERREGKEIWPARHQPSNLDEGGQADIDLCKALDANCGKGKDLDW